MVKHSPASSDNKELLAQLAQWRAQHTALLSQAAMLEPLIIAAENYLGVVSQPVNSGAVLPQRVTGRHAKIKPTPKSSPFYGLPLAPAAVKQLSLIIDKSPQAATDLWEALHSTGYNINAQDPVATLSWQLRKREKKEGDVLLVGNARFALASWYTKEEIERIKATRGGQPWRDRKAHAARTKAGMKQAAEERGIRIGAPRTVTAESMAKFLRLRDDGITLPDAAKAAGIGVSTYQYYRDRYELDTWHLGDQWPPPRRTKPRQVKKRSVKAAGRSKEPQLPGTTEAEMRENGIIPLHGHVVRG
jgi:hypothetical protein